MASRTAIARKLRAIPRWLKSNPLIVLAGVLASIFGFIVAANNAIPVVLSMLNRPDCFTYASVYRSPLSYFKKEGELWREYPPNGGPHRFEFREIHRTRAYIDLLNLTPRVDPRATSMIVRLPVCGGTAKWTYQNPEYWIDLFEVWRN